MENKEQTKKGLEMLDRFAMNILFFFADGKKNAAMVSWNHLMGAATLYAYAIHEGEKTSSWFADNALRTVCEIYQEDFVAVKEFLGK